MKISIKLKTVGMVLLVGIVLTVAAATASYRIYADNVDEHYRTIAMNLAKTEAFYAGWGTGKADNGKDNGGFTAKVSKRKGKRLISSSLRKRSRNDIMHNSGKWKILRHTRTAS